MLNTIMNLKNAAFTVANNEEGQDLAEYALVLVFVAIVAVAGVTALGGSISDVFDTITAGLAG